MKRACLTVAILMAAMGTSSQAGAVRQPRQNEQTAVGHCQAALPSFEGVLRKRPLGIANEGSIAAFVNCGMSTEIVGSQGIFQVDVALTNRTANTVDISCTLISGLPNELQPAVAVFPKTFVVAPGPDEEFWSSGSDGQGTPFKTSSIQCALPPGTEINGTRIFFDTDVGQ